jgi:hypothetical protein
MVLAMQHSPEEVALAAREALRKVMPSRAFIPNGKQEEFMLAVGKGRVRHYDFMGGNGGGKTAVLANIFCQIIYGKHGWFTHTPDLPMYENWEWPKVAMIMGTPSNFKEGGAVYENLHKYLAPGTYTEEKQGKEYTSVYKFPGYGWTIVCFSYEQDTAEIEGKTIGLLAADEPMPEGFRGPAFSRLRMGGIFVGAMTPLDGASWVIDLKEEGDPSWHFTEMDVEDACVEHGVRGHLQHEQIQAMIDSYPLYEREARKSGKPLSFSSLVYPGWSLDNIVDHSPTQVAYELKNSEEPPTIYMVLDPHDAKPWVITWWAVYKDGRKICFQEWPDESQPAYHQVDKVAYGYDYYVEVIRAKEQNLRVHRRVVDQRYGYKQLVSKQGVTSIVRELRLASGGEISCYGSRGQELDNRNLVAQAICPVKVLEDGGTITQKPLLLADRNCKNFIYAMQHHTHKRNKGIALDTSNRFQEQVTDKNKCFPNTAEYLLGFGARWIPAETWLYNDCETEEIANIGKREKDRFSTGYNY